MYYFLELQTLSGSPLRLSFVRHGDRLRLVQQQLEGRGRLVITEPRHYSTFTCSSDLRVCKIWGEDFGVGKIWLDLFPSSALPTFSWGNSRILAGGGGKGGEDSSTHSESLPSRPSPPLGQIPE
jgi:hypothetical protein